MLATLAWAMVSSVSGSEQCTSQTEMDEMGLLSLKASTSSTDFGPMIPPLEEAHLASRTGRYFPFAAGYNGDGQLCQGNTGPPQANPVRVADLDKVHIIQVSTAEDSSYFRSSLGEVFSCGANGDGELGLGDFTERLLPTRIPGLPPVRQVVGGDDHVVFVNKDGTVWGAGQNEGNGDGCQLGPPEDGQDQPSPKAIKGTFDTRFADVGEDFNLFLHEDGTVWSNGENDAGQLGLGMKSTSVCVNHPILDVPKAFTVAAGEDHGIIVTKESKALVFGTNSDGQLGLGKTGDQIFRRPVEVPGLKAVLGASAGSRASFFLTADGEVYATGLNEYGGLGLGHFKPVYVPTKVPLPEKAWKVVAGDKNAFFMLTNGLVMAAGRNGDGQLGIGDTQDTAVPKLVKLTDVIDVAAAPDDTSHTIFLAERAI